MKSIRYTSKLVYFLIIIGLSSFYIVNAEQKVHGSVDARTVTVNGIRIGDGEPDVIRILGNPLRMEKGFSEPLTEKTKDLRYKGLHIYLTKDWILSLSCKKLCVTDKGIKIGDSTERVISAYGTPLSMSDDHMSYVFCAPKGCIDSNLYFNLRNGLVTEIVYFIEYV